MANVTKFEDLIAWQKARTVMSRIYQVTRTEGFNKDFGLSGQMQRAAVSIMSNIAEGFDRESTAEFNRFLLIAKGSCAELRSQLYVALDIGYLPREQFDTLFEQINEVGRIISGLRNSLDRRPPRKS